MMNPIDFKKAARTLPLQSPLAAQVKAASQVQFHLLDCPEILPHHKHVTYLRNALPGGVYALQAGLNAMLECCAVQVW